jgi:hypothetical protein
MNFYDLYTDALEKVANDFASMSPNARVDTAVNILGNIADMHDHRRHSAEDKARRLGKMEARSGAKMLKPGLLSTIAHGGRKKAKASHRERHALYGQDRKDHADRAQRIQGDYAAAMNHRNEILAARKGSDHAKALNLANHFLEVN